MKKNIILLLLGLINITLTAQIEKEVKSKIVDVTVYQRGAEISRKATISLAAGKSTIIFKGLTPKIDAKSIQAAGNNGLMITSVSKSIDYLNKLESSVEIKHLKLRQLELKDSLLLLDGISEVYNQEKEMILSNKTIGGTNGIDILELEKAAIFFRKRLTEIETAKN